VANDTLTYKRKREEEDMGSDILPNLRSEMQCVDTMMRVALLTSQTRAMTAFYRLELKQTNLNVAMVHEIGKTSSVTIMELSDGSHSE
jgi:hypothetical protein